jgi:hypothetical protein
MAWINSGTLPKPPRRTRFSVNSRNQRSTRFSQDELVGVKRSMNRWCFSSQAFTLGWLCDLTPQNGTSPYVRLATNMKGEGIW